MESEQEQIRVSPEAAEALGFAAQSARLSLHMLEGCGDPDVGSNFHTVNALYPYEKASDRARSYAHSALQHLSMWADFFAPLKFHPEQGAVIWVRPAYTLARAAMESSAQAIWMMDTRDPKTSVQRHLRLIRWDLDEHRKSKADEEAKGAVSDRDRLLLQRVSSVFESDELRPPNGYLYVLQQACNPADLDVNVADLERIWRAASGAAHGMYWTNLDLQTIEVKEEYEPGQFRTQSYPDTALMAEALNTAASMVNYAVLKYLDWCGVDPTEPMQEAIRWLAHNFTPKPDANVQVLAHLRGVSTEPDRSEAQDS
ncbi:hypothetical protein [Citricoccus nitrophenolicus]|uniref:hypothetical protein n=1 Tax=Citricoccus nitrophenolicus TaxID=863575 RepID=UPI0039B5255A